MELTLLTRSKRVKEKVKRDHYWYDSVQKKMLQDRGGEMRFRYDPQQKRSLPYLVDHEDWVYRNDYPEVKKWVNENKDQFDLDIVHDTTHHIVLQISARHFDAIQSDLHRNGIVTDWNESELRRELRG